MQLQNVFQAGNSNVIAIPKHFVKELGFGIGKKVVIDKAPDGESLIVKPVKTTHAKKSKYSATSKEFNEWLEHVIKEDAGIIDELAKR